ncbi:hypothetical protein DW083_17010 [Parabacteroides sp. AF48-14]|uniref:hypothetical protein n=1 Tax=Parabacteroides sp. AF48-14 TaxID=2292052 RepID=UPI000EFF0444|nr:hypothetical protein [Parabacteroides sp. AF48-14]RHO67795.1 hypothetical protein DW083_17010 [Parabacteroides sp. AF48-14]
MRRVASHYIYWKQFYRMHYVELDDKGVLTGVFPLEEEIAGTEFYDGILFPVVKTGEKFHAHETKIPCPWNNNFMGMESGFDVCRELGLPQAAGIGEPACLLLLNGISLTAAKLGTDDGCRNGYIKRL